MRVREAPARAMIAVKGDLGDAALRAAVADAAGAAFPEVGEVSSAARGSLLWMAPDEVLVLVAPSRGIETLEGLRRLAAGRHMLVEDVSDMRAGFVVEGPGVREVLARVTPADVSPAGLPPHRLRRSRVGQVAAAFWLPQDDVAELLCFRSVAGYVIDLLGDAAQAEPLGLYHVDGGG